MPIYSLTIRLKEECGMSLPVVLFMVLAIMAASAIFATVGTQNIREIKLTQVSNDSFYVAEGALQDFISQLAVYPQLWRERPILEDSPNDYNQYNPLSYDSTNGIPSCSGESCQRQLYPIGGGLIKNFGPIGSTGDTVNTNQTITQQLNLNSLPPPDVSLNNRGAWYQVERLDETSISNESIGASLSNYEAHNSGFSGMRFRITSTTVRNLKGRSGRSTVVAVVELPPT